MRSCPLRLLLWCGVLFAGCGGRLVVPLYDEAALVSRHPGLQGRTVAAEAYTPKGRPESVDPWSEENVVVSVGDRIRLNGEGENDVFVVRPDGSADFPGLGKIPCADRPLEELRADLERRRGAAVRISVASRKAASRITVVGMANYEGEIEWSRAPNLRQALIMAGGLSRRACLPQILVVRPSEGRVILCDYYRYAEGEDERQNLELVPGDVVVAPELYDPDRQACAAEWGALERFFRGEIDRVELVRSLHR